MKKPIIACLGAALLAVGCNQADVREVSQEFNQLPEAVQQSVRAKAPAAEVAGIEEQARAGQTTYVIQFRDPQRHPAMEVAADGRLVKYEAGTAAMGRPGPVEETQTGRGAQGDPLSALPVGVQKAIAEHAPKAEAVNLRRREENGQLVYVVEYAGREPRPILEVTAEGTVLKRPGEVTK